MTWFHPSMTSVAAKGRMASLKWRLVLAVIFAGGIGFAFDDPVLAIGWMTLWCASMALDAYLGAKYLSSESESARKVYEPAFILACTLSSAIFVAIMIFVGWSGGPAGYAVSVSMAASTLVSVILFPSRMPLFMVIGAAPSTVWLLIAPFALFATETISLGGLIGAVCATVCFLAYAARTGLNGSKLLAGLEAANDEARKGRAIAELRRAEAESANRAKSEFLTMITHELRTPLNAVIGYSEMIAESLEAQEPESVTADADRITAAARHLLGLIDQIIEVSSIDLGKDPLSLEEIDVGRLIESCVAAASNVARANNNRLVVRLDPDVSSISTDAHRLGLSIQHLVSNAVKFTSDGEVTVTAQREILNDRPWLRLAVADTGVGMTAEQMTRAFSVFTQLDGSLTRAQGGLGLGLAIAVRAAKVLGGRIEAVSEPGAGSTFTLLVPMQIDLDTDAASTSGVFDRGVAVAA